MDNNSQNYYQQYNTQEYQPMNKPDNCLVWAILSTILCCTPLGIVSIVYATKVDSLWLAGQYTDAYDSAHKAKMWAIASIVVDAVTLLIALAFWIIPMLICGAFSVSTLSMPLMFGV